MLPIGTSTTPSVVPPSPLPEPSPVPAVLAPAVSPAPVDRFEPPPVRSPVLTTVPTVASETTAESAPVPAVFRVDPFGSPVLLPTRSPDGAGPLGGEVKVSKDRLELEGKVKGPKGLDVGFGASGKAQTRSDVHSEDGYTTYTVTSDVSVTVKGKVDAGVIGFGAEKTEGAKTSYQVRMTDEDYQRMLDGELPPPDPFHPETMREGTSIIMNSEDYEETGFSVSYRRIGIDSNVGSGEGTSIVIEAGTNNRLSVTAGPTEALENGFKLGVDLGVASGYLGNTRELDSFNLNTATFDLDSKKGHAAYNDFLVAGTLPEKDGAGVSDVARIQKLDYSSTTSLGGKLGELEGSIELGSSELSQVLTTYPDGTAVQVSDFKYVNGIPGHLEQTFNADGTEDLSEQKVSITLQDMPDDFAERLEEFFSGLRMDFSGDKDVTLTFTAEDAQGLRERAQQYIENYEASTGRDWDTDSLADPFIDALAHAEDAADVATAFATAQDRGAVFEALSDLSTDNPEGTTEELPGYVHVG